MKAKRVHYCAHLGFKDSIEKESAFEILTDLAKQPFIKDTFSRVGEPLKVLRENSDGDPSIGADENSSKVSIKIYDSFLSMCFSQVDDYYPEQSDIYTLTHQCIDFVFKYMKPKPVVQGYLLRGIAFVDDLQPGYIKDLQSQWFTTALKKKLDDDFSISYELPDELTEGVVRSKVAVSGKILDKSKNEVLQIQYDFISKFYDQGMTQMTLVDQITKLSARDVFEYVIEELPDGKK